MFSRETTSIRLPFLTTKSAMKRRYIVNTAPALCFSKQRSVGDADMPWPNHHIERQGNCLSRNFVVYSLRRRYGQSCHASFLMCISAPRKARISRTGSTCAHVTKLYICTVVTHQISIPIPPRRRVSELSSMVRRPSPLRQLAARWIWNRI
jgi:hypothetical protein